MLEIVHFLDSVSIIGVIYANDKNSPIEVKQRGEVIDTLHFHLLQWQSPVAHLYPSKGGLHVNVQFSP